MLWIFYWPFWHIVHLYLLQASELLGVQSPNLEFSLDRPSKIRNTRHQSTSSLHLNNNTYAHVAFRLVTETLAEHFVWPPPGTVPPRCRYTLAVTMRNQQKPRPDGNAFFTLESTMASIQGLHNFRRYGVNNADKYFTKAKERGREVHQINLTPVYVQKPVSFIDQKHMKYLLNHGVLYTTLKFSFCGIWTFLQKITDMYMYEYEYIHARKLLSKNYNHICTL